MLDETLLSKLTAAQRSAVLHRDGPLLVIAGPGSGKTRVVTHRVAQLLSEGVPAGAILVLTFTNKAAEEMKERVRQLVGISEVWIGTFHRFCARLLRQYAREAGLDPNYSIYSASDSAGAVRTAMNHLKELDARGEGRYSEVKYSAESISHALSALKNRFLDPEREFHPESGDERGAFLRDLFPILSHEMRLANAVDFDDLLLLTVRLLAKNPQLRFGLGRQFQYVLVDEYQDTNLAQYAISRAITQESGNLMAAGDPDQSIYGWRGADISNILEFEKDFPAAKIVNLEENFRSTQFILNAAGRLIEHNTQRKPKALFSHLGNGLRVRLETDSDETAEAERIAREISDAIHSGVREAGEFAVFYRMNALSVHFEKAFRVLGIPFRILHGTEFFERGEIRDLLAYFRLLANPHDSEAFLRVVNVPARGIGKTSLGHLQRFAREENLSLWEAAVRAEECVALKSRATEALAQFVGMIRELHENYVQFLENIQVAGNPVSAGPLTLLAECLLEKTEYEAQFSPEDEQDAQRLRNVQEFLSLASRFEQTSPFPTLEAFLEQNSLVSAADEFRDPFDEESVKADSGNVVSLMTLHAAKGLEFPCVYLTGCEHGILPHERAFEDELQLEEERRLMFVGMTRAKEELILSMTVSRDVNGRRRTSVPSSFLMELPRDEMEMRDFQPLLAFDEEPSHHLPFKKQDVLDDSFGEGPQEEVFSEESANDALDPSFSICRESMARDEAEAFFAMEEPTAEPNDFDFRIFDAPASSINHSSSSAMRVSLPKSSPQKASRVKKESLCSENSHSELPILKKIPHIPGVTTAAELLRKQREAEKEEESF